VDTSIGYWFTNNCDKARLSDCSSQGHASGGYIVDSGCTNGVIQGCSSGGGDGKWRDYDSEFYWAEDFSYDKTLHKSFTFGGAPTTYNLFKVTGSVRVFGVYGDVTTVIPNTASTANLELYSVNANPNITNSAGAPNLQTRVVGTILAREGSATDPLEIGEPNATPAVTENANYRDPKTPVLLTKDNGADTYIQLVISAALASGAMHWHVEWEPATDDGFLEPA